MSQLSANTIIQYMKKKRSHYDVHQIHYDHQVYWYQIGEDKVLIKNPDGTASLYDKNHVKGESRPNLFKRLFKRGKRNIKVTHVDVEKFIQRHY